MESSLAEDCVLRVLTLVWGWAVSWQTPPRGCDVEAEACGGAGNREGGALKWSRVWRTLQRSWLVLEVKLWLTDIDAWTFWKRVHVPMGEAGA